MEKKCRGNHAITRLGKGQRNEQGIFRFYHGQRIRSVVERDERNSKRDLPSRRPKENTIENRRTGEVYKWIPIALYSSPVVRKGFRYRSIHSLCLYEFQIFPLVAWREIHLSAYYCSHVFKTFSRPEHVCLLSVGPQMYQLSVSHNMHHLSEARSLQDSKSMYPNF